MASFSADVRFAPGWTEIPGPIGPLYVAWSTDGVVAIERAGDPGGFELTMLARLGREVPFSDRLPAGLARPLTRAVQGGRRDGVPIDMGTRTAFEALVLRTTMTIPWGEVRPYAWVAREAGRPRAVRAVGSAMAGNSLPFLVPCHRVVKTDGHIGEYGPGGPAAKRELLRMEGLDPDALDNLADRGVRYLGDPVAWRFCFPTCARIRLVAARDTVLLRDGESALEAGYGPCPACRPLIGSPFR
jgi:O-6-methylguanine DNA methyltransferase